MNRLVNRQYRDQLQDRNINVGTGDYGRCLLQQTTTDPALGESWGSGFEITDPHTLQSYVDTDPGPALVPPTNPTTPCPRQKTQPGAGAEQEGAADQLVEAVPCLLRGSAGYPHRKKHTSQGLKAIRGFQNQLVPITWTPRLQ